MKRAAGLLLAALLCGCESTPVLLFHHVGLEADAPRWISSPAFREQMSWLRDEGYTPITVRELDAINAGERPAPDKPIALTFDDGYQDFYQHAYPVLRELGFKSTMFLISGVLADEDAQRVLEPWPYLVWPEVLEMMAHGVEMQSHTVTHPALARIPIADARREIFDSKRDLEARLGQPVTALAYPGGNHSIAVRALAEEAGYLSAYSVGGGINRGDDRIRISVSNSWRTAELADALEGTWWGESSGAGH